MSNNLPFEAVGDRVMVELDVGDTIKQIRDSKILLGVEGNSSSQYSDKDLKNFTIKKKLLAYTEGKVVSIGPCAYSEYKQSWVKVGDKVRFGSNCGEHHVLEDGRAFNCLLDKDVCFIIKE